MINETVDIQIQVIKQLSRYEFSGLRWYDRMRVRFLIWVLIKSALMIAKRDSNGNEKLFNLFAQKQLTELMELIINKDK